MKDFAKEGWLPTPHSSKPELGPHSPSRDGPHLWASLLVPAGLANGASMSVLEQDKGQKSSVTPSSPPPPLPSPSPRPSHCASSIFFKAAHFFSIGATTSLVISHHQLSPGQPQQSPLWSGFQLCPRSIRSSHCHHRHLFNTQICQRHPFSPDLKPSRGSPLLSE